MPYHYFPAGTRQRAARWAACIGTVVALLAVFLPAPASAHSFGLRKMDNHAVDFASDEDNTDHHLYWNHFVHFQQFDQYDARTDLAMTELPRWGWNSFTDIVWFATPLAPGVNGDEMCRLVRPDGLCDRAVVRFDEDLTRDIPGYAGFFLVCHEFGHAYGFEHMGEACMRDPWNPYVSQADGTLSDHMIGHINAWY
jgi:hypothetical protein